MSISWQAGKHASNGKTKTIAPKSFISQLATLPQHELRRIVVFWDCLLLPPNLSPPMKPRRAIIIITTIKSVESSSAPQHYPRLMGPPPTMYRVFFLLSRKVWKMKFWNVPLAVRLILQLPTAHAGRWNFPRCHLPNLATERKKTLCSLRLKHK